MAIQTLASVAPREEIARIIMEGANLNKSLIWDKILPPLPLTQRTAHLPKLGIANGDLLRILADLNAPGTDIQRMTATVDEFTFNTELRKVEIGIPYESEWDYAQIFSLVSFYANQLGNKMLSLTAEYLVKNALFNTTTFGAATNSAVAYTVANKATNSFIDDIFKRLNDVYDGGELSNAVVLDSRVLERVSQADTVKSFVIGALGPGADTNATTLERAFKSQGWDLNFYVGRAAYNSGAKGVKSLSRIWTTDYIWVGRVGAPNEGSEEGMPILDGVGHTPYWEASGLFVGDNYIDQPKEQTVVRGKFSGKPTITNAKAGALIATQYA